MAILDRFRKPKKPLSMNARQPDNFYLAVQKYKDRPGVTIQYSHKKQQGDLPQHVADIPMEETLEIAKVVESFIQSRWGGGYWKVAILDNSNRVLATYNYAIAGSTYNTKTGKKSDPNDPDTETRGTASKSKLYDEMIARVMEKNLTASPLDEMTKLATVMQQLSGGSSALEGIAEAMITTQFNNNLTREESRMQELKDLIQLGQMFTPKVNEGDAMTNLMAALPGILSGLAMMKGGGNSPVTANAVTAAPSGNGGVDMNALKAAALSMTPEMIQMLPSDQQAAIMKLRQDGSNSSAMLPRPGAATPDIAPGAAEPNPNTIAPAARNSYMSAIDSMVADIRSGLARSLPDDQIARKMIAMVTYARGFAGNTPHPLLEGILKATDETGQEEFVKLCSQIPELGDDVEHIQKLGTHIMEIMKQGAAETLATAQVEAEAADTVEPPPVIEFQYETEQERKSAQLEQEVKDGTNAPGPTGVSAASIDEEAPGVGPSNDTSEDIRQSA